MNIEKFQVKLVDRKFLVPEGIVCSISMVKSDLIQMFQFNVNSVFYDSTFCVALFIDH